MFHGVVSIKKHGNFERKQSRNIAILHLFFFLRSNSSNFSAHLDPNSVLIYRDIGFSDFVHRPKTQYLCVLYTIVRTL
jgi:hypothetical protein